MWKAIFASAALGLLISAIVIILIQPSWLPDFLTFVESAPEYRPKEVDYSAPAFASPETQTRPRFYEPGENVENAEPSNDNNDEVTKMTIRPEMDMQSDRINKTPSRLTGETSGVIRLFRSQMSGQLGNTMQQQEREHRGRENGNLMMFAETNRPLDAEDE